MKKKKTSQKKDTSRQSEKIKNNFDHNKWQTIMAEIINS